MEQSYPWIVEAEFLSGQRSGSEGAGCGHVSGAVGRCFRRGMAAAIEADEEERRQTYLELARSQSSRDPFLDMVAALISRGVPVFPLAPKSKRPLLKGWQEIATTDPLILMWWVRGQQYNIGVPTGRASGWVVVDPDGEVGRASWAAWQAEHGEAPPTLTSITGRADLGHHLVFSIPKDEVGDQWLSGGNGLLGEKLDVKADGAFVVVPPSVHPKTGKQYQWVDFDATPAPLPQPIVDLLVERGHRSHCPSTTQLKAPRSIDPNGPEAPERHRTTPWGSSALAGVCAELAAAKEGTRDNGATYASWRIGRLAASRQIDWVEGIEQLEEALKINGLGASGVKWHAFEEGYRVGLAQPVGPPPLGRPIIETVDEETLSQLSERFSSFSTNWDRRSKRRSFHPRQTTDSQPVNGYNPDGPFAEVMKARGRRCTVTRHIIANSPSRGVYDLRVPCSVRACKICAASRLVDIAAFIQDQVRLRPGGTFYRADVDSRGWGSLRRSLAADRHDVDYLKLPTTTGFAVLAYTVGYTPPGFDALDGWSAFLDAWAEVWASMPTGRQIGTQIRYSHRWRAAETVKSDDSKRIGMTFRPDEVHALIEQHGGSVIREGRTTTWRLPEDVSPEQIIDEHIQSRRSRGDVDG